MAISLLIHATHEAGAKIGGIGAVLDGMLSAESYVEQVERTVLVGPLYAGDSAFMERMLASRNQVKIRYSSLHAVVDGVPQDLRYALQAIEQKYQVALLYGTRQFGQTVHEIVLVDASNPNPHLLGEFQYHVWSRYGINSSDHAWNPEYQFHFAIAQPLFAALKALDVGADLAPEQKFVIAHEWIGMPVVFAAQTNEPGQWKAVFYAHEMATARRLIEDHSGHDTRFYNAKWIARSHGLDLDTTFGDQGAYFKHAIIKAATQCDVILAVGDLVVEELRFLGHGMLGVNLYLAYNGIHAAKLALAEKLKSQERLQRYCLNLFGYRPDYVFSHVTRFVPSKALWRDARVLWHLNHLLAQEEKRAVLFVLSTVEPGGRRSEWVRAWEEQYGWPVGHRGDNGDLIGEEADFFFHVVEPFNQNASHCKIVFVNQFGWSQDRCGSRMPADMEFTDIRNGTDLEFGQSIYEPFGIAQVEALGSGALCCVSSVCGCIGFVKQAVQNAVEAEKMPPLPLVEGLPVESVGTLIVADYVTPPGSYAFDNVAAALAIDGNFRDWIENGQAAHVAEAIHKLLPRSQEEIERLLTVGQTVAENMSWDVVIRDYFLPALESAQPDS